jgi:hypothetical protein
MEIQLNDYHKKVNAQMQKSMAYWREHPLSLEECLAQFKRLQEQRNVVSLHWQVEIPHKSWGRGA